MTADVWRYDVVTGTSATVPLYLLDVDLLTDALYSGDREHRIRQELLLGVGGVRALAALGLEPTVFHVNEGHSAFLAIERARILVEGGLSSRDALEQIRRSTVFTTHTPVPAGNEVFGDELVLRYASDLATKAGISDEALLGLGRSDGTDGFGLTPLALRLSAYANGVSALHGEVAREMWSGLWPARGAPDRPHHERCAPRHVARAGARRAPALGRRSPRSAAGRGSLGRASSSSSPRRSGTCMRGSGTGSSV